MTTLEIKRIASELQEMYKNDPRQDSFNLLLLGPYGSGKSFLTRTCRKPVHIDSFDPGGTKGLKRWIEAGEIIVDTCYEAEDREAPWAYIAWKETYRRRFIEGYYNYLGTYILDSSTLWNEAIMNWHLKSESRAGKAPHFTKDYVPQKIEILNMLKTLLDLPCDFILTGHLEPNKDEVTGALSYEYLCVGKASLIIPLEFDEIWVMRTEETSSGTNYKIQTQSNEMYRAASRLAQDGLLNFYEEPDIKKILEKVDHRYDDKPLFHELLDEEPEDEPDPD